MIPLKQLLLICALVALVGCEESKEDEKRIKKAIIHVESGDWKEARLLLAEIGNADIDRKFGKLNKAITEKKRLRESAKDSRAGSRRALLNVANAITQENSLKDMQLMLKNRMRML